MVRLKTILACMIACAVVVYPLVMRAQNFTDTEVKAAYIMKLAKFMTWNDQHLEHIHFCYIESSDQGEVSVGGALQRLVQTSGNKDWIVKKLRGVSGAASCDMLFIADSEENSITSITSQLQGLDVFTLSDIKNAIHKDIMLGFVLDDQNRVKMEANLLTIRKTNVMVSANVLELMQQVIK